MSEALVKGRTLLRKSVEIPTVFWKLFCRRLYHAAAATAGGAGAGTGPPVLNKAAIAKAALQAAATALEAAAVKAGVGSLLDPAGPSLMGAFTDAQGGLEAAIQEAAAQSVAREA